MLLNFAYFLSVQHAKSLVLAVYKALRSLEGIDGYETDEAMSVCSEATMYETFIEPIQGKFLNLLICVNVQENGSPKKINISVLYFIARWKR